MREALLDVNEVSAYLRVHPKTVYEWRRAGRLPSLTINGRVRFEPAEVDRFVSNGQPQFIDPQVLSTKVIINLDYFDRVYLRLSPKGGKSAVDKNTRRRWNYGFGSIYLRKTKEGLDRWAIDYLDRGKRIREVIRDAQTREDALVALQARVAESFSRRLTPFSKAETISFARFAATYLDDYSKATKRGWVSDASRLKANLIPFFGGMRLQDITPLAIEKYRTNRLRSVSKPSINRELALLKSMFNRAIDWGHATENPVRKVKMFSELDNLKERILSEDEETRLLAAAAPHLRTMIVGLLMTGARWGELNSLRWSAVDLERGTVLLTKTKSGRNRIIPINDRLRELLVALKAGSKCDRVFTGPKGRPIDCARSAFEGACRRAGLSGLRLHDLRHTFATRLVRRGVDIITVQSLLGHSSVTTTERYTHSGEEQKREAVRRLEWDQPKEDLSRECHAEKAEAPNGPVNLTFSVN